MYISPIRSHKTKRSNFVGKPPRFTKNIAGIFKKKTSPCLLGIFLLAVCLRFPIRCNLSDFLNPRGFTNKEKRLIGKSP